MSDRDEDLDEAMDDDAFAALVASLPDTLGDPAVWAEPPAWLEGSVVAAIAAERDERATAPAAPLAPARPARTARRTGRPRQTWWLAAAAAAIVVVAAGAVALVATRGGDGGETYALDPTEEVPGASGTATLEDTASGLEIVLDVRGLPPAGDGQFYQAWMRSEEGDLVSIGTFHLRGGDDEVTLWSGVDAADYPILTVTIQTEGEGTDSSGIVVLRGSIAPD